MVWDHQHLVELLGTDVANMSPTRAAELTDHLLQLYRAFNSSITQSQLEDIADSTIALIDTMASQVESAATCCKRFKTQRPWPHPSSNDSTRSTANRASSVRTWARRCRRSELAVG